MHQVVDMTTLDLKRRTVRYAGGALQPYGPEDEATIKVVTVNRAPLKAADCPKLASMTNGIVPKVVNTDDSLDDTVEEAEAGEGKADTEAGAAGAEAGSDGKTDGASTSSAAAAAAAAPAAAADGEEAKTGDDPAAGAAAAAAAAGEGDKEGEKEENKDDKDKEEKGGGFFGFMPSIPLPKMPLPSVSMPAFGGGKPRWSKDVHAPMPTSFLVSARNLRCVAFNPQFMDLVPSVAVYITVPGKDSFHPVGDFHETHCPEPKLGVPKPGLPFGSGAEKPAEVAPIDVVNPSYLPAVYTALPDYVVAAAKEVAVAEAAAQGRAASAVAPNEYLLHINWLFVLTFGFPSTVAAAYAEVSLPNLIKAIEDLRAQIAASAGGDGAAPVIKLPLKVREAQNSLRWVPIRLARVVDSFPSPPCCVPSHHLSISPLSLSLSLPQHPKEALEWDEIFEGEDACLQLELAEAAL